MSVHKKLSDARELFHRMQLKKTGHNKFAGYNYFELGDFLIPALSVFREVGLLSVISFGPETATMKIINIDQPSDFLVIESPMSSAALKGVHEVQNLGAVQTYLRRYLWVTAMEIVEHDALDATTGAQKPEPALTLAQVEHRIQACTTAENVRAIWPIIKALPAAQRKAAEDVAKAHVAHLEGAS